MKILHVIPGVAQRYGGPSQAIFEMCRALRKEGVDVLLATTDADGAEHLPVPLGTELEYQGVRTLFFAGQWGERFNYSPSLARWLDAAVEQVDAVHIHAVFSHPCLAAARACRKRGVPYVVRPLGSLDPWSMSQKPLRKRLMWRLAGSRMLKEAASIHYTTSDEKNLAEASLGLKRGAVIPLGIDAGVLQDTTSFEHTDNPLFKRPYVLALSRIHPKKNIELLIETFAPLTEEAGMQGWRLVIAGDGDANYVASLQALAQRLDRGNCVIFAGWLEGAAKLSALQGASLFALPSKQENFGIAAAEALACGVPVVVSEHVNLASEIKQANAGWVTSLKREEFTRTLTEALSDEAERKRRGAAGKAFVEKNLTWTRSAAELKKLYSSIIRETRSAPVSLEEKAKCTS